MSSTTIEEYDSLAQGDDEFSGLPFEIKRPIGEQEVWQIIEFVDGNFLYQRDYDRAVVRNLLITLGYYDLSVQMDAFLGFRHLNWCSFALWASNTAGMTIRKEFAPFPKWFVAMLTPVPFFNAIVKGSSEATILGNLKVFSEIGPFFARMIAKFENATCPNEKDLNDFLDEVRAAGEDLTDPLLQNNNLLVKALRIYYQARFENDPDRKAELVLLANCFIGLHEQTRLQEQIVKAMELPVDKSRLIGLLESWVGEGTAGWVKRRIQWAARLFATSFMLKYRTPYKTLSLGGNVYVRASRALFPPELQKIDHDELREFIERYDRNPDSVVGSGAEDWSDIRQRMMYILELFRTHQRHRQFLIPPFTPTQQGDLELGKKPKGKLNGRYPYSKS